MAESDWKMAQSAREAALAKGEEIAKLNGFAKGPVDPFKVIASEGDLIHVEADDFRDSFDGRLSYHNGRFLLIYNTRYDAWPRNSPHHPKTRFTIAHELGHFYLDSHREFLVNRRKPIESFVEFESNKQVEREADAFASGLLMPEYLVGPPINRLTHATIGDIKTVAKEFDVSLTSMLVRWTQVSHFPCATLCVREGRIQWGFVSHSFQRCGLWKSKRGTSLISIDAKRFVEMDPTLSSFREGSGTSRAQDWLEGDCSRIEVEEFYLVIPYSQCVMIFLAAEEQDSSSYGEEDD